VIRVVVGYGLLLLSGHGLLRLASGRWPHRAYGPIGALALSWLGGVAALATVTTFVGVLGARTTPLPLVAPVLGLLGVAGLVPLRWPRPADSGTEPRASQALQLSDLACGLAAAAIGIRTALLAAPLPVWRNDEYAIWMVRARALSQFGSLDPRVFLDNGAHYQQQTYPLLLPSLAAWGDRWAGRPSDAAAHLGSAMLLAALLATTGWAVGRLVGPLPAFASVALVAAVPTVLSHQSLEIMADIPVLAFGLSTALVLLLWLRDPGAGRPLLAAGAVLAAGACATKVEGALFAGTAFLAALLLASRGRRRGLLAAGAAAVAANLPWLAYTRAHHLRSWAANDDTLTVSHLRHALPFSGQVIRGMADRWPGGDRIAVVLLLAAIVPAAVVAARRGAGRVVAYLALVVALEVAALVAQYVVTAHTPVNPLTRLALDSHLDVTVFRVTLVPAALLMIATPLLAGFGLAWLRDDTTTAATPGTRRVAQRHRYGHRQQHDTTTGGATKTTPQGLSSVSSQTEGGEGFHGSPHAGGGTPTVHRDLGQ
jgi:hypothetical protein